jgi:hypothetical protein
MGGVNHMVPLSLRLATWISRNGITVLCVTNAKVLVVRVGCF